MNKTATIPHKVGVKIRQIREIMEDVNFAPLELIRIYKDLLRDYSLVLQCLQTEDEHEDAKETIQVLRETFASGGLHNHVHNLDDILQFAEICEGCKYICDNIDV